MSQVVHLDKVKVVFTPYQIRLFITPYNATLISQPMAITDTSMHNIHSPEMCHEYSEFPLVAISFDAGSLQGTEVEKNILFSVE